MIRFKIELIETVQPVFYPDIPKPPSINEYLIVSSQNEFIAPDRIASQIIQPAKTSKPLSQDDAEKIYETWYDEEFIKYAWMIWWINHD